MSGNVYTVKMVADELGLTKERILQQINKPNGIKAVKKHNMFKVPYWEIEGSEARRFIAEYKKNSNLI